MECANFSNVQEVVSSGIKTNAKDIAELKGLFTQQEEKICKLMGVVEQQDNRIGQLVELTQSQAAELRGIEKDVKQHLPKTFVELAERVAKVEVGGGGDSSFQLNETAHSHHVNHLSNRVEHLERNWEKDGSQKDIMKRLEEHLEERLPQFMHGAGQSGQSPLEEVARLEVALSGNLANTDVRVETLEVELNHLRKAMSAAATQDEVEDLRDEVVDALEAVRIHKEDMITMHKHGGHGHGHMGDFHVEKENAVYVNPAAHALSKGDRVSILDEVAISRPDRSEVETLVMSRLEPVAGSVNSLHMEVGELRRHVSSLPPVPAGLVDQEQLGNVVNDAVKRALSSDGGRVSHAHLTVAIDSMREGLLRQMEGNIAGARAQILDNFTGELGNTKESTWETLSVLKSRVDDIERTVEVSNGEIVNVLNQKAYKADVSRALSSKADKDICMNTLRLKADSADVNSNLSTKADVEMYNRCFQQVTSTLRDLSDFKEEVRNEHHRLNEQVKAKVDFGEVEGLKIACATGAEWRSAVSDVSINLRRELADKANREEMIQYIRRELDAVNENLTNVGQEVGGKCPSEIVTQVNADLDVLTRKFGETHSEARWLWRSGKVCRGGFVPWEVQVNNACPQSLLWKVDCDSVTCTAPGLYVVKIGVFTQNPAGVQLCVNGEPVISLEPTEGSGSTVNLVKDTASEHIKRRNRHSAGDITAIMIDEVVALPPNAMVGVRYDSGTRAQGFMQIRKM
ncbi:hypothetical protein TrLO_g1093 [Triparma laevis f. longispina]|uniref:Uncharacterized protein n=1 Tax=Triparma laevis f. longispina TaxID=1714387 RepID=A0A9W7KZJ4_9STRA|nr:hypothetical protein TrLO_g1093 [Triparma laevis f. longispina]